MRGRKRTPTALAQLRGNPGKRRRPRGEPKPAAELPEAPLEFQADGPAGRAEGITEAARREWDRLVPELYRLGLLTKIDRQALIAYCTACGVREYALLQIRKLGLVIKTGQKTTVLPNRTKITSGGTLIQSPFVSMHNQAVDKLVKIAGEFGMTPASRSRIDVHDAPAGKTEGEAYLEGKGL